MFCRFVYFFFYSYALHRYLHSFPTRRSSDLTSRPSSTFFNRSCVIGRGVCTFSISNAMALEIEKVQTRSEEHTSELQSHHDLVCRLLLEKKKKHKDAQQRMTTSLGGRRQTEN